jgi:predicted acylesterase/phospholipase RssA
MTGLLRDCEMNRRHDTIFVLGGGANLGAVQVGMLDILHGAGIRPDVLIGASVGALNGVMYAANPTGEGIEDLKQRWMSSAHAQVFKGRSPTKLWRVVTGKDAILPSDGLAGYLADTCPVARLEDLTVPLHVAALDATRAKIIYRDRGPAVPALMASCAIPGVFPAYREPTGVFLDGGSTTPIPLGRAIALAPRRLFILDASAATDVKVDHALNAVLAGYRAARYRVTELEMDEARRHSEVIHINVALLGSIGRDFTRGRELIEAGAAAATEALRDTEQRRRWSARHHRNQ